MNEEQKTIHTAVVREGQELPTHQSNIIHTADVSKFKIRIFYVE